MTTNATIQKWGNSQGIRIPKFILEQVDLDTNSDVSISVTNDSIIIKKATKKHIPLAERFADYTGEAQSGEYDWGEPQGEEAW
ncbi:MAG: AbrB/MazE/SpoVT family DNA-binding domain-containing protein [Oscillospiraceae bacterium]|nr:AbrB/MazE/SpoVT family DNA-binding domain-containing protein [Oscillospiraceae bacterium]